MSSFSRKSLHPGSANEVVPRWQYSEFSHARACYSHLLTFDYFGGILPLQIFTWHLTTNHFDLVFRSNKNSSKLNSTGQEWYFGRSVDAMRAAVYPEIQADQPHFTLPPSRSKLGLLGLRPRCPDVEEAQPGRGSLRCRHNHLRQGQSRQCARHCPR
jgi:hypothetical protein